MSSTRFVVAGLAALLAGAGALPGSAQAAGDEADADWQVYAQARSWAASDVLPIADVDGDWSNDVSPRNGRNVVMLRNRAEVGVERGPWQLGWEYRQEAVFVANRAAIEFLRRYKQRASAAGAADYTLAARLENWSAQGPRLGRWFGPAENSLRPRVHVAVAYYTGANLRDTSVDGAVSFTQADQVAFNVRRSEFNSRDRYPFMQGQPGASGASASAALAWRLTPRLALDARVDDLLSVMRWRQLPLKEDRIDSRVASYDADGYINYQPLLSGVNRQLDRRSALTRTGGAALHYDAGAAVFSAGIERLAGVTMPSLAVARPFGWGTLTGSVDTRFGAVGVGIDTARLHLAVQTDNLRLGRAKAAGITVGLRY